MIKSLISSQSPSFSLRSISLFIFNYLFISCIYLISPFFFHILLSICTKANITMAYIVVKSNVDSIERRMLIFTNFNIQKKSVPAFIFVNSYVVMTYFSTLGTPLFKRLNINNIFDWYNLIFESIIRSINKRKSTAFQGTMRC